jgi:hypothetical protein
MRVGAPITLEPGPDRISPPKRLYNFFSDRASHRQPLWRQAQAPRSHPRGSQQGRISMLIRRFILRLVG